MRLYMKIAIVDDEEYWRNTIFQKCKKILSKTEIDFQIKTFPNGESLFQDTNYDILFLDIEMQMEDGLQIAEKYRTIHKDALLVFITSHTEFSRKGYLVDAFRYIIKENLDVELDEAIHAALPKFSQFHTITFHILNLGNRDIKIHEIYFLETEKRNIRIHLTNESFLASDNITDISEKLLPYHFYRTHKSFLVNMAMVSNFDHENIYLINKEKAMLSTRHYPDFKKTFFEYKLKMANK